MALKNRLKGLSNLIKNIKLAQFAVVVASLVAGYFVYQDYAERQAESEYCGDMKLELAKQKANSLPPEVYTQLVRTCAKYWYR